MTSFTGCASTKAASSTKWRDSSGKQIKRRVGPAWLVREGKAWRPRRGRVPVFRALPDRGRRCSAGWGW
jgi:hypothetical protein